MTNYCFRSKNMIQRVAAITRFQKRGYKLVTALDGYRRVNSEAFPWIVTTEGDIWCATLQGASSASCICCATLDDISAIPIYLPQRTKKQDFPTPKKYRMVYQKKNGEVDVYTVSNPIDSTEDMMTAYAFGHGVRSFLKNRIHGFTQL